MLVYRTILAKYVQIEELTAITDARETATKPKASSTTTQTVLEEARPPLPSSAGGLPDRPTTSRELITSRHFHDISIMDSTSTSGKEHKYNKVNTFTIFLYNNVPRFTSSPCL
jgi:hypothetical protein